MNYEGSHCERWYQGYGCEILATIEQWSTLKANSAKLEWSNRRGWLWIRHSVFHVWGGLDQCLLQRTTSRGQCTGHFDRQAFSRRIISLEVRMCFSGLLQLKPPKQLACQTRQLVGWLRDKIAFDSRITLVVGLNSKSAVKEPMRCSTSELEGFVFWERRAWREALGYTRIGGGGSKCRCHKFAFCD